MPSWASKEAWASTAPAWLFLGGGGFVVVLYVVVPPPFAAPLLFTVPVAGIVAVVVGIRRNEIGDRRRPWAALAAGLVAFLGAAVLRTIVPGASAIPPEPVAFIPDVFVVPGYALFAAGLIGMLRRRRGAEDALARADAVLIGVAASLAAWSLLLAPRIETGSPSVPQVAVAIFPIADVLLLVLVIRLMVADGVRQPALWLLGSTMALLFSVDLIFAVYEGSGSERLIALFDVLFMTGYLTTGAAALHPTMSTMSDPQHVVTRAIGMPRILTIAGVVMAPTLAAYLIPAITAWDKLVRVMLAGLLAVMVVTRIVRSQASQARAEADARHQSTHDALTDLPNREFLADALHDWSVRAAGERQQISLLFVDLDRFKQVNDSWGHHVGDELLRQVAARLSAIVRGDLVCRIGGDEFVVAFVGPADVALAQPLAERLVTEFKVPFHLSVGEVTVTPSIGVVETTEVVEALGLIRDADMAMYQAKGAGGNTFAMFDASLRERARARIELEQALRGAVGRGELSVAYQPIVRPTGELSGFEALMRWTHPVRGAISPEEFIPIAELTGLIVDSGAWLLEEALDQFAVWQRDRDASLPPLHVSVNVSPRQLRGQRLVDVLHRSLQRTGLPPSALWLEITESVLMGDPEMAITTLNRLRALGVTLCIDDFGTGHASLAYVRDLPADVVKIDKKFIHGIGAHRGAEAIVTAVIAMAHGIGQRVVAEGVETVAQRDWLAARGCDLIQGWLFGPARPAISQDAWRHHALAPRPVAIAELP